MAWFQSYLFKKTRYSRNTNDIKYLLAIDCGAPQESTIGPLLFSIHVNDFYFASKLKNFIFADDTNLFISDENIGELVLKMNKELKNVTTWSKPFLPSVPFCLPWKHQKTLKEKIGKKTVKANKLSINIDKTKWTILLLKSVSCLHNFQNYPLMA